MDLKLQSCEGEAHTGETTLTAEEVAGVAWSVGGRRCDGRAGVGCCRTLKVTLSHPADIELVDRALSKQEDDRRARGEAVNLLLTVIDRVFPKARWVLASSLSSSLLDLRKVLKAVSIGTPHVDGQFRRPTRSCIQETMTCAEMVPLRRNAVASVSSHVVKRAGKVGTITDIKVGEVPEWQMLRGAKV